MPPLMIRGALDWAAGVAASALLTAAACVNQQASGVQPDSVFPGATATVVEVGSGPPPAVIVMPCSVRGLPPAAGVSLAQLTSDRLARAAQGAVRAPCRKNASPAAVAREADAAVVVSCSVERSASGWVARALVWRADRPHMDTVDEIHAATLVELPVALAAACVPMILERTAVSSDATPSQRRSVQGPADRWFERFLMVASGEPDPANGAAGLAALEQLDREWPREPDLLVRLGRAYLDRAGTDRVNGRPLYDAAHRVLRAALEIDPVHPGGLDVMAALYTKTGHAEESAALLKRALEIYPASAVYWSGLGYSLRYAGMTEGSIAAYRRSQQLDRRLEQRVESEGQIAKGLVQLGRYEEAEAAQRHVFEAVAALGRTPDEKMLFYDGLIKLYRGNRENAQRQFAASRRVAHTLWSEFAEGYRLALSGSRGAVAAIARRLEQEAIVDGERRYRLVHLFTLSGDREAALQHLASAIKAGFFNAPYFATDPLIEPLRGHAAFKGIADMAWERHNAFRVAFH